MTKYITHNALQIDTALDGFIETELLAGLPTDKATFYDQLQQIAEQFQQRNLDLLTERDRIQAEIDEWHRANPGTPDAVQYKQALQQIGYFDPEPPEFTISTQNVDPEVASMPGPQLVVPVMNARYALNAANARWGSLYDALYGSDVIPEDDGASKQGAYNPVRGARVINFGRTILDEYLPLAGVSHKEVTRYMVVDGELVAEAADIAYQLSDPSRFKGWQGESTSPEALLLEHNSLHMIIRFDDTQVAKDDKAGVSDIVLESALSAIQDCEDSVAAVDGEDKVVAYRNWLGLMRRDLSESLEKGGKTITRQLNNALSFTTKDGELSLKGNSLLFVRNVGHLMPTPAVLFNGEQLQEGLLDALVTVTAALYDLASKSINRNSYHGSVYIVKPKMHGAQEVRFTVELFDKVEKLLGLRPNTVKIGIMDEERRTSVNLAACIYEARERVAFINTGFLDRTGDDIHTSMCAGPFLPKGEIKGAPWFDCYEDRNVTISLHAGFRMQAQIGKGMWPVPDNMADMMLQKIGHPKAAATCAWVPSPTAATLHALHYHQIDVLHAQMLRMGESVPAVDNILKVALLDRELTDDEIVLELKNNLQGILGYVVRWVEQGVGCSKVPDINNVGLMEDRATLRISAQHVANWLYHNVCSAELVEDLFKEMAAVVDEQNAGDPLYRPMAANFDQSVAFNAARALVFEGLEQPSGYTEPLLHSMRRQFKMINA